MSFRSSHRSYQSWQILLTMLVLGALIGGWLGELLAHYLPVLQGIGRDYAVGIPTFNLDLKVLIIHFGLTIKMNLFSLLGMVGGFFVYRQM